MFTFPCVCVGCPRSVLFCRIHIGKKIEAYSEVFCFFALDFHDMDPEIFQRLLALLVKRGRAQVFGSEDQQGVKFF